MEPNKNVSITKKDESDEAKNIKAVNEEVSINVSKKKNEISEVNNESKNKSENGSVIENKNEIKEENEDNVVSGNGNNDKSNKESQEDIESTNKYRSEQPNGEKSNADMKQMKEEEKQSKDETKETRNELFGNIKPEAVENDLNKLFEYVQNNKDNPELMQKLLSLFNVNMNNSTQKEDTTKNEQGNLKTNEINISREEQDREQNEITKKDMALREKLNKNIFYYQTGSHGIGGSSDKQESRFCKMFPNDGPFNNKNNNNINNNNNMNNNNMNNNNNNIVNDPNGQNQKETTEERKLDDASANTDMLNQEILSTLISDYSDKQMFDEVKEMMNNIQIRKDKDQEQQKEEQGSEIVKQKHDKLVEDEDEYDIDTTEANGTDENAAALIAKINLNANKNNGNVQMGNDANSLNEVKNMCDSSNYAAEENTNEDDDFKLYHSKHTWVDLQVDKELINVLVLSRFYNPSKIQAFALPFILNSNRNLIAQSQNGSGKTLTFVVGMLSKINRNMYKLQAICICPTRELSQQNFDVVKKFAIYLKLKVFLAIPLCERYNKNGGWQLYVGTPGKTLDFLKRRYIETQNVKLFVLDEADDLIDVRNNMATQVDQIKKCLPRNCQVLLFSATYNKQVLNFADRFAPQAIKIRVRQKDLTLKCVKQFYLLTENDEHKYYYLSELYCSMTISQCVIFVNSKQSAFNLYKFMTDNNHNVTLICADSVISRFTKNKVEKKNVIDMDPKTRDTLMSDFKKGISKVLICTDLLSRGIDIPSISLVINFDLPYIYQGRIDENANSLSNQKVNMETYIHRIGRTGRFGSKGMAINFIKKQQLPHIKQIEQYYQCTINDLEFDSELMKTSIMKLNL